MRFRVGDGYFYDLEMVDLVSAWHKLGVCDL